MRDVGQECAPYAERGAQRSTGFSSGVGCDVGAQARCVAAAHYRPTALELRYALPIMVLVRARDRTIVRYAVRPVTKVGRKYSRTGESTAVQTVIRLYMYMM